MKLEINLEYHCSISLPLDLPEGKTLADVKSHFVKWGTLTIVFNDGTEFETCVDAVPSIDFSRTAKSEIVEVE